MMRGKVTAVDASGVYVQTAEYGTLGPCQAVVANYAVGDMVLCVNVADEASPELVVVGRLNVGSSAGLDFGSSGPRMMAGTGGPSGISAPVGSTWRQTDANASHGSLTGLLWNKVGTGTAEGAHWLVDYEGRWASYSPTWSGVSMSATAAKYTIQGKTCHLMLRGVLSAAPSGAVTVTLPDAAPMRYYEQAGPARLLRSSTYNGAWSRDSPTTIRIGYWNSSNVLANLSATAPASWASGDRITLSATYEINV